MTTTLTNLDRNSQRLVITFQVVGDPGEDPDISLMVLAIEELSFPPNTTANEAADAIRIRATELYAEKLELWAFQQELAQLLREDA